MSAFDFMNEELTLWDANVQARAILADAHFKAFDALCKAKGQRERFKLVHAMRTIRNAAEYIAGPR